jgi:hypothetical protein
MALINVQKQFDSTGARLERTITVKTNGGSVTIEASLNGDSWVLTDTISVDGGYVLFQGKAVIRITPNNGAEYQYI